LFGGLYHRFANGTITRISIIVPGSPLIYAIFQNAGKSYNTGFEVLWSETISKAVSFSINGNIYRNTIDSFSVLNLYPTPHIFSADK